MLSILKAADITFWSLLALLVLGATTAIVADRLCIDRKPYPEDTFGFPVQILLFLTGLFALVVLLVCVVSEGISNFSSFGRCAKYATVPVESVIPKLSYSSHSQLCSAQLAVPRHGAVVRIVLEADCHLGLDTAKNTKSVDICYRQFLGSWRGFWIPRAYRDAWLSDKPVRSLLSDVVASSTFYFLVVAGLLILLAAMLPKNQACWHETKTVSPATGMSRGSASRR